MIIIDRDKYGYNRNIELDARLFEDRCVFLVGPVEPYICKEVCQQLMILDSQSHEDIWLYVATNGGEVLSGMSVISVMDRLKSRVNTVVLSVAASMGSVIASNGYKRYCYVNAHYMCHSVKSFSQGHLKDMLVSIEQSNKLNNQLLSILAKNCGYSLETMIDMLEHDVWLDAESAIKWGICDYIL